MMFAVSLLAAAQAAAPVPATADPAARMVMARFASCVAQASPDKVSEVLTRDFRTSEYRNGLKNLVKANEGCAERVGLKGKLYGSNLSMAAALAEVMIERDAAPLNVRLAKAAIGKEAATFAPSDKVAMCVARSTPDDVATLFGTEAGSDSETQAAAALQPAVKACSADVAIEAAPFGLRAILATASFRLLAAQES